MTVGTRKSRDEEVWPPRSAAARRTDPLALPQDGATVPPASSQPSTSNELEQARVAYRLGKVGMDVEEEHEADKELTAAAEIYFPGLSAAIREAAG